MTTGHGSYMMLYVAINTCTVADDMPWLHWLHLQLLQLVAVLGDPELLTDKWSGCGEVTSDDAPLFFSPCATSEWEVLLTDTMATQKKQRWDLRVSVQFDQFGFP